MLKLKFLGELNIRLNGKSVTDKVSSKSVAILALLFSGEKHQMSRRELMSYLWPDSGEDAAKYNLRFNLWQMRKLFSPEKTDKPFIKVNREYCSINPDYPYECDLEEILRSDIEQEQNPEKLEKLFKLFTGDFLQNRYFSGCAEFEEMMIMQRYSLENKKMKLLKKLISVYYREGKVELCLKALVSCEEMDPYDEENARIRIELLVKEEKYNEAIHYYQRFYSKLTGDIGTEPCEELKHCAGRIRKLNSADRQRLRIFARALPHIEYYWMAEVIKELLETEGFQIETYLEKAQISDLAYIQYRLGECRQIPSATRIADGFLTLIFNICEKGQELELELFPEEEIDPISADVIKILKERKLPRLYLTTVKDR